MRLSQNRLTLAALGIIMLLGALFRLHNLDAETIGHLEIYVPNIPLPWGLSFDPPPRLTLAKTISGPIAGEPHPPGFYVFMFVWTKLFGTGQFALRLPIALLGIACIPLVYAVGARERDRLTGLLAAGMLALSGLLIYWSRIARMYGMATFLGLLATLLLLRLVAGKGPRRRWEQVAYVVTQLAGMATVLFYWSVFFVHLLWTFWRGVTAHKSMRGLLRLQMLTFVLGSPLWAIVVFQSRYPSPARFEGSFLSTLSSYLQFGILLEPDLFVPDGALRAEGAAWVSATIILLVILALALVVSSLRHPVETVQPVAENGRQISNRVMILAGAASSMAILLFTFLAYKVDPPQAKLVLPTCLLPWVLVGLDWVLQRKWLLLTGWGHRAGKVAAYPLSLSFVLAAVPVLVIEVLSLFASRTVTLYVPYLLVILAGGLGVLLRRNKVWRSVLLAGLIIVHGLSAVHYERRLHHPTDYQGLAAKWKPEIEKDDLIFVQRHWITPSIFYYLRGEDYHFVGEQYSDTALKHREANIWVLSFNNLPNPPEMEAALADYQAVKTIEALRVKAIRYARRSVPRSEQRVSHSP